MSIKKEDIVPTDLPKPQNLKPQNLFDSARSNETDYEDEEKCTHGPSTSEPEGVMLSGETEDRDSETPEADFKNDLESDLGDKTDSEDEAVEEKIDFEESPKASSKKTSGKKNKSKKPSKKQTLGKTSSSPGVNRTLLFAVTFVESRAEFVPWPEEDVATQEEIALKNRKKIIRDILPLYSATVFAVRGRDGKVYAYLNPGKHDPGLLLEEFKNTELPDWAKPLWVKVIEGKKRKQPETYLKQEDHSNQEEEELEIGPEP